MKAVTKKSRVFSFIILAALLTLGIVLINVFQKEVRSFFYWFSCPIQKILWQTATRTDELKQENQYLTSEIIRLKSLEDENKTLREALNIGLEKEYNLSFADVISKDASEDIILIDKGSKDGISQGMNVITAQKVLVGKVVEVFNNYSKVMLIYHKKMSFDVKIGQEEINAIAKGQGNLNIIAGLIPQEKKVFKGDIVSTSGLEGVFPEGLLVGKIEEITKNDIDPFQTAKIEKYLNVSEIKNVFIIL